LFAELFRALGDLVQALLVRSVAAGSVGECLDALQARELFHAHELGARRRWRGRRRRRQRDHREPNDAERAERSERVPVVKHAWPHAARARARERVFGIDDHDLVRGVLALGLTPQLDGRGDGFVRPEPRVEVERHVHVRPAAAQGDRNAGERASEAEQRRPRSKVPRPKPPRDGGEPRRADQTDGQAGEHPPRHEMGADAPRPDAESVIERSAAARHRVAWF